MASVRNRVMVTASLVALVAGPWGCRTRSEPDEGEDTSHGQVVQSEKPRDGSPSVDAAELTELVAGNSAFAFDLYQSIRDTGGNLFYSPYSISLALAMTYAGARNQTDQEMADTLHFTLSQERLHPAFNALDLELASRGQTASGKDHEPFQLNIVNAIWGQTGFLFRTEFLDVLAVNYGAGLRLLDFFTDPEGSRLIINDWVSEQTHGRITDLVPPGVITALTRLVLVNAVYFNAAWKHPFAEEDTVDGPFHLMDGTEITVPMMEEREDLGYAAGDGYQAVELPYDGDELSMVIVVPDAGEFDSFEETLDIERFDGILDNLSFWNVGLTLPKFTYESEFGLSGTLASLGMLDAFSPDDADFSGMTSESKLYIQDVVHKAFVSVDEAGTEAAAATAVIIGEVSAPEPLPFVELTVDRPFIFVIRDIETGAILFVGRVLDPAP
jgi:serpin B